ncbi:MAG: hypothetical protein ACR2ML_12575 [Solirubrobacteraceae bacterium]
MRHRFSVLLVTTAALGACALAPPAHAEFFPGEVIDGLPGVFSVANVDVAVDGTGGIAYLRSDGGVGHLFVSRLLGGAFLVPERVDVGVAEPASDAGVVATEKGRLTAAWSAGGRLMASIRPPGAAGWPAPTALFDERALARTVTNVSVDVSLFGAPYIVFTTTSPLTGSDVRVARFDKGQWIVEPVPLDFDPARNAGEGAVKRPDVSVSAEGSALAVWGEDGADGRVHVLARRITRRGVASTVREVSLSALDNRPPGNADSAEVALELDASYGWVVFRQTFDDGGPRSRAIARRLVGSEFDPPVAIDGLGFPAPEGALRPQIDIDGRGRGVAVSARDLTGQTIASVLREDVFGASQRLDSLPNAAQPYSAPAAAENGRAAVAWQQSPGGGLPSAIRARAFVPDAFEAETELSRPELGSTAADRGLSIAADRTGDTAIAFIQGGVLDGKLVAAVYDRRPGRARPISTTRWLRTARPTFRWEASSDVWGNPTYRVVLDGQVLGQTSSSTFVPSVDVGEGVHRWRAVAVDRRGQEPEISGSDRLLRIDRTPPTAVVTASKGARTGKAVRFGVAPRDLGRPAPGVTPAQGSGVIKVGVDYGDGSRRQTKQSRRALKRLRLSHVYRRPGRFTVTTRFYDQAGNVGKVQTRVNVKRG